MIRSSVGVILNVDGTLIDSYDARTQAWVEALKEFKHPVGFRELRRLCGLVSHELLVRATGFGEDTELGFAIRTRQRDIFRKRYLSRIIPFLGAGELVLRMRKSGLAVAIVSSDPAEILQPLLGLLDDESLMQRAAYPNNHAIVRSYREILRVATERLSSMSDRVLMLTASPHEMDAAKRVGVPSITFRTGGFSDQELRGSTAIYNDVHALVRNFARSPFFGNFQAERTA